MGQESGALLPRDDTTELDDPYPYHPISIVIFMYSPLALPWSPFTFGPWSSPHCCNLPQVSTHRRCWATDRKVATSTPSTMVAVCWLAPWLWNTITHTHICAAHQHFLSILIYIHDIMIITSLIIHVWSFLFIPPLLTPQVVIIWSSHWYFLEACEHLVSLAARPTFIQQ